ncbi:MAG TPA: HD domain-containing protein [Firmicutes bacterium]|jgi:putative nucleotidyltransferase with HDIG domain|nr:HD domain-containing protein [Bacillota bacterium]
MGEGSKLQRLYRQWRSAVKYKKDPQFNSQELKFLQEHLTDWERALFEQMDYVDQRHALAVSQSVVTDPRLHSEEDKLNLIKAALLHDIGKIRGDFTITQRVLAKIIKHIFPEYRKKLLVKGEKSKPGTLARAVFVQEIHPNRGAYMLSVSGTDQAVVELVRNHHNIPRNRLERILQDSDRKN